jgi:hypothetical protein
MPVTSGDQGKWILAGVALFLNEDDLLFSHILTELWPARRIKESNFDMYSFDNKRKSLVFDSYNQSQYSNSYLLDKLCFM